MEIGLKLKYILHFGEFLSNLNLAHSIKGINLKIIIFKGLKM